MIDFVHSGVQIVIEHLIFVAVTGLKLYFGNFQPIADHFVRFGHTPAQALLQNLKIRRIQEDGHTVRANTHYILCPLHLDDQKANLAPGNGLLHPGNRGAVIVAGILGIFKEATVRDHLFKIRTGLEKIIHAVHFAGSGRPGGGRNGFNHIVPQCLNGPKNRVLAATAGCGQNN